MTTPNTYPEPGSSDEDLTGTALHQRPWRAGWWMVGVGILTLILFLPTVRFGFTGWDDGTYITTNPDMNGLEGLARVWTSNDSEQYYPLTFTTYWIEYQLGGISPAGYHASNVLLHAVNACLVLLFLRSVGLSRLSTLAASLLFAIHPVQVMSVAWIPGRKNLLSTLFALLAMLAWVRFRRRGRQRWYFVTLLAFALGLLSKSAIVTLPVVLVALDRIVMKLPWRRIYARAIPLLVLACASALVTVLFEKKFLLETPGLGERVLIASSALWLYALHLVCPLDLSPFYPPWEVSPDRLTCYLPLVGLIVIGVLLWRMRRRWPWVALGTIHFLAFLLPALGLVPYGNMAITYVSDHYLYLACLGFFIALAGSLERYYVARQRRRIAVAAVITVGVVLVISSFQYLATFRDGRSMWTHTLKTYPDCYPAHVGLGHDYFGKGKLAQAINHYRRAAEIMPDLPEAQVRLGNATLRYGDINMARNAFERGRSLHPDSIGAAFGLAIVAERTGDVHRAKLMYERTVQLEAEHCKARLGLAAIALRGGAARDALAHSEQAIESCPQEPRAYLGLATCLRRARRAQEAVVILDRGLAAAPDDLSLLNFLARILATDPDDFVRDGVRAIGLAKRACEKGNYTNHDTLDTLAAAYAEAGRFAEAEETARRGAQRAATAGATKASRVILERARQYGRREPLREIAVGVVLP